MFDSNYYKISTLHLKQTNNNNKKQSHSITGLLDLREEAMVLWHALGEH